MMTTARRIIKRVLCFAIVVIISMQSAAAVRLDDIAGHYAEDAVMRWSGEYGIIEGSGGMFRPDASITRAEFAVILDRMMNYTESGDNVFADVESGRWYAAAINKLAAAGIMKGDGVRASPTRQMTRQEAVVLVARAFGIPESRYALTFSDTGDIASWAYGSIAALAEQGYMRGGGVAFLPKQAITRAEVVMLLDGMVGAFCTETEYSADVDGGLLVTSAEGATITNMKVSGNVYIAPSVTGTVILDGVEVAGSVINLGNANVENHAEMLFLFNTWIPIHDELAPNPFDPLGFYKNQNGVMYYSGAKTYFGVDVSEWQGVIDWGRVASVGVDYAMLRVGYRGYGAAGRIVKDLYFDTNITEAADNGIETGVYFYSQAITVEEAIEEANFVLQNIAGYDISYPVVYDWENVSNVATARTNGLDPDTLSACARAFCDTIAAAGYTPMIYYNPFIAYMKYDITKITGYDVWLAEYADAPAFLYEFNMWQYTSSGRVSGIQGNVDMNISFVDYSSK